MSWRRADLPGRPGASEEAPAFAKVRKAASEDGTGASVPSIADGAKQLRCAVAAEELAPTQCLSHCIAWHVRRCIYQG